MLLGLPLAGHVVFPPLVAPTWREDILARFAGVLGDDAPVQQFQFGDTQGPTKQWLQQFRSERLGPDAEEWRVQRHLEAYLLWLFGWVLFTSTHQDTVDKHLVLIAQQIADADVEQMPQYSWGSAVLACTYRALCDACTRRSSAGSLTGCPLLLMLWSCERFDIGRPALRRYEPYDETMYHEDEDDGPTMGTIWCKGEVRIHLFFVS